jgi:hypothetical protein
MYGTGGVLTLTQLLLVGQSNVAVVVDLGAHRSLRVQVVLAADAEPSVIVASRPRHGHGRLKVGVHLVVDGATKLLPVVTARPVNIQGYL